MNDILDSDFSKLTTDIHATSVQPAKDSRNESDSAAVESVVVGDLTFSAFRKANAARCVKWHPEGIDSWSPSDWMTAVTGELGELASLLKMRNRERDGLPGNKFSPTDKQIADELADVLTYLDLLAEALGVDLGRAAVEKFNQVSERVGFPDRITLNRAAESEAEKDAWRYRWLRDTLMGAVGAGVEVNEAALVYEESPPREKVRVYWYPNTPVGFNEIKADTLDEAIDAAAERE